MLCPGNEGCSFYNTTVTSECELGQLSRILFSLLREEGDSGVTWQAACQVYCVWLWVMQSRSGQQGWGQDSHCTFVCVAPLPPSPAPSCPSSGCCPALKATDFPFGFLLHSDLYWRFSLIYNNCCVLERWGLTLLKAAAPSW